MANFQSNWSEYEDRAPSDQDKELYERARNAADEAVREGNAQLKAAMAAAGAPRQCVVGSPTRMNRWSLGFSCPRLEASYRQKTTTNTDNSDHIPVILKTTMCVPQLCQMVTRMASTRNVIPEKAVSPSEFIFCDLWAVWAAISCLAVLTIQLIYPQWYKSKRGATLKYLVILLWAWESVKLYLNTDEMYILMEVGVMNVFMSILHRVPFISHLQCRIIGCGAQLVAIMSKGFDANRTALIMLFSLVTNAIGLVLAYFLDRAARRQYLKSLPVWLLEEISGSTAGPQFYLSYRASLSQQLWSVFYPELVGTPDPTSGSKTVTYEQIMAPRRALGGFAGGFGGVSSLKCTGPVSNSLSPVSSSSSMSGRTSDTSSGDWAGVGVTESGLSCGEIVSNGHDSSSYQRRESALWGPNVTTSACSQVGMEDSPPLYMRNRGQREASEKRGHFY